MRDFFPKMLSLTTDYFSLAKIFYSSITHPTLPNNQPLEKCRKMITHLPSSWETTQHTPLLHIPHSSCFLFMKPFLLYLLCFLYHFKLYVPTTRICTCLWSACPCYVRTIFHSSQSVVKIMGVKIDLKIDLTDRINSQNF